MEKYFFKFFNLSLTFAAVQIHLGARTNFQKWVSIKDVGGILIYIYNILLRGKNHRRAYIGHSVIKNIYLQYLFVQTKMSGMIHTKL